MAETAAAKKLEIKCRRMRVSFVKVFRAEAFRGSGRGVSEESGQKAFSLNVLIPKDTKEGKDLHEEIEDAIDEAMDAQWGRDKPKLKPDKFCLRDGDDENYNGYGGHWYVAARNTNRPKVRDADGETQLVEEDGRPYSGCYCNVWIRVWAQDNKWGKRVNASLEAVQFVKDGEAFSGVAPIPDEEFEDEREAEDRGSRRDRDRGEDRGSSRNRDGGSSRESGEGSSRRRRI